MCVDMKELGAEFRTPQYRVNKVAKGGNFCLKRQVSNTKTERFQPGRSCSSVSILNIKPRNLTAKEVLGNGQPICRMEQEHPPFLPHKEKRTLDL